VTFFVKGLAPSPNDVSAAAPPVVDCTAADVQGCSALRPCLGYVVSKQTWPPELKYTLQCSVPGGAAAVGFLAATMSGADSPSRTGPPWCARYMQRCDRFNGLLREDYEYVFHQS
jgi:hypothetical protein